MINFTEKRPNNSRHIKQVRQWVETALPPEHAETTVMVNELKCLEPECPPLETVLTLLDPGKPLMWKVFKPVSEVERAEVLSGLRDVLAGNTAPQHATASALQRPEQH